MKKFSVKPKLAPGRTARIGGQDEGDHVFLGRLAEAGQLVRVDFDLSQPHVVAIFGKRGSGKSYTLGSFLEGLCTCTRESSISSISGRQAALLFDTLGIFQWLDIPLTADSPRELVCEQRLLHRGWDLKVEPLNVKVWAPRGTPPSHRHYDEFTINCADFLASDWGYLLGLDILQDRMGQLLSEAYEKVVSEGWSDGTSTFPPMPRYAIEDLMDCVHKDTELAENYHRETRRAVLQQLSVYWRNPLFQPKRRSTVSPGRQAGNEDATDGDLKKPDSSEGTPLTALLKPGNLSVVLLHKISDEMRFVLIVSIIRKIMQARIETSEMEKNLRILPNLSEHDKTTMQEKISHGIPPTWVVADEAQNFLPSERKTTATDVLVRLVREGRNFGLSFMVTTQQPSAIDQRILAQVDTLIVHKLTVQGDIECVRRNLKCRLSEEVRFANTVLSFDDMLRMLDVGQAIVSNTEAARAFFLNVRPRCSVHGGFGI